MDPTILVQARRSRFELWLRWTLASAMGGMAGLLLGPLVATAWLAVAYGTVTLSPLSSGLGSSNDRLVSPIIWLLGLALGAGVTGATLGASQRWALQPQLPLSRRWVWMTGLGWALSLPLVWIIGVRAVPSLAPQLQPAAAGLPTGLLVGVLQGLILQGQIRRPGWWAVGTMLAVALGWTIGWMLLVPDPPLIGYLAAGLVGGAIVGAITGGLLIWPATGVVLQ